jgi:predicted Zn-dependent protease
LSLLAGLLMTSEASRAQSTSFSFTLDEPCKTSAGVFATDGTLIRTLWSKVRYNSAGVYSAVWDGLDDNSNAAPAGTYQIRLLEHNTEYVWDGAIGNSSAEISGPTVHKGFYPMRDMAISGTNGFYVSGYNEGQYDFRSLLTTDPQRVKIAWGADGKPANIYDPTWNWTATDGHWVYFACSAATNPTNTSTNNFPGFVLAAQVGAANPAFSAYFTQGVPIVNGLNTNTTYPNGVYVGTQPGLSGLAVQQSGNLLAVSVALDNAVYLLDKQSGAAVTSFAVNSPGRLNFSPDGSLWVISGSNVVDFTGLPSAPSAAATISSLLQPLALAVNQTNPDIILVADGGNSQQVKAFNSTGASLWTYGLAGGYPSNGIAVETDKFWFSDGETNGTFLCFAPDGSFWVGDGGNHRSLHFSAALNYLEQIMYQPHSYIACVDQNNPARVFNQFLEFSVDYTKPLAQSWTLVNNWKANVPAANISLNNGAYDNEGLYEVTTFTNGRTYALIDDNDPTFSPFPRSELCELVGNQLRLTGLFPAYSNNRGWISLGPDGSARRTTMGAATWYEDTLAGFDSSNNPVWNPETLIASASQGITDPVPRFGGFGNIRATVSSNNILVSFDQTLTNGWHLGGIRVGSSSWLWKASPAVAFMNGTGTYEISNGVTYGGDTLQAVDRNIIFGYHGEFFRNQGQAGQHMHFYDDGLFVGQFGEATPGHSADEGALPGFNGNGHCPSLIKTSSGDYYIWDSDEAAHGPQRWHLVNARNIRELTGSGSMGGTITLTNPPCNFPTGVTGLNGNQSGQLSWLPVAGATSYKIRYSQMNGGPYNTLAGNTANLSYTVGGLSNGETYYFAITAVQGGQEGPPSEQVAVYPFDTTQKVLCAGSMTEGGQLTPVIDVSSTAPALGQASYETAEHDTGLLNLRELDDYGYGCLNNETVGTAGYELFNWQGVGNSLQNVLPPFSITYVPGWSTITQLQRQFRVDNVLGTNLGMTAIPLCSLKIGVTDTNYHFLTVVSPDQFNDARQFAMRLTSTNNTSAVFNVNENPGLSHVFQFLFQGDVTLWADASAAGGTGANVQAVFLDNAPVITAASSTPAVQSAVTGTGTSTITLTSSQNPALSGSQLTFTAQVTGTGGGPTFASSYIPNGLVEWNKLNDGTGAVAADASGNNNTLPLLGTPAWDANYLTLDGTDQYGDAGPNQLASLDLHDLTICAWVNKSSSSLKGLVDKSFDFPNVGYGGWSLQVMANNHLDWWVEDGFDLQDNGGAGIVPGQWTFVTFGWHYGTRTGDFYINGILDAQVTMGANIQSPSGSADLEVGNMRNNSLNGTYAFDGAMHDVGIYNRVLSQAEVESNYLTSEFNTNVNLPDLLYYQMTESAQSNPPVTLADSSTSGASAGTVNSGYVLAWVTNVAAIPNTALHFNGVSTYIDTGNATLFNFTTNLFTINIWARPLTANGMLMENEDVNQATGWDLHVGGSYQVVFGAAGNYLTTGAGAAQVGDWTMITIVRSGPTSVQIYINGIQVATSGSFTNPLSSVNSLLLGVDRAGAHFLDGDLWLPQIWGEALPATAIANLYFQQSLGIPWPVTPGSVLPTGTVTFYDGSTNLGSSTLNSSGTATFSTAALSGGGSPHAITAVYSGDSNFGGSTSSVLSQVITNPPPPPLSTYPGATNGLVAWYPLAGDANDYSGNGNNGAIMGGSSFTTGVNGAANTALSLNGSSQYVSLGHPTLYDFGNNDFTFSVWFQTTTTGTPQQLFSCDDMSGRQFIFDINDLSAGTVTAYLQNQSAVVGYRTGNILSPNTWYHAVLVRQGNAPGALTLYLNGAAVSSFAAFQNDFPFTMGTTTSEVDIGRRTYAGYQQYFSGSLSDVAVYNRALSASEVATLYTNSLTGGSVTSPPPVTTTNSSPVTSTNAGIGVTNGLVAWYPLAGDANDYSGNGNNGTLGGYPSFTAGVSGAANTALSLNGSSQYVSLGHPSLYNFGSNDFTFSLWFQTTATGTPQQLFSCDDASGRQFIFDIDDLSAGTVTAYLQNGSAVVGYRTGNILSPNTWYHAVLVRQGNASGALTLYLNGTAVSSFGAFQNDFPFTMGTTSSEVDIGRRTYAGYQQYFSGSMSSVAVYNRALAASEVATLYTNGLTGTTTTNSTPVTTNDPPVTTSTNTTIGVTNGLVAYYPLAGDANDYSGNGNNGTMGGNPSFTVGLTGAANTALSLNGSSQYVSLSHPSLYNFGNNDFTFSLWFQTTSTGTSQQLFSCDDMSGRQFIFDINDLSAGTVTAYLQNQSAVVGYRTGNILSPNTWYHAVLVRQGNAPGALTLYLNGAAVSSFAAFQNDFPFTMGTTTSEVDIGRRTYAGYQQYFSGAMSGIAVYNRALSASEVATLYTNGLTGGAVTDPPPVTTTNTPPVTSTNTGIGVTNGLVAWYPLAGDANDYSGNGNNGTVMGGPSFTTGVNGAANTALSLNGSSQYVSLGHPTLYDFGNNDFTFSVWFQTTTTGTPQQLFSCDDPSGRQFIFDINDLSAGTVTAYLQNGSSVVGYRTGNILSPNTWYHAVLVRQGNAPGALTLCLNGAAVTSFAAFQNDFPFTMGTTGTEVDIGRRTYSGYQQYFSGSMSGIAVYNRALSAGEVVTLYTSGLTGGSGTSTNIVSDVTNGLSAWYPLAGDANDYSGNGNNGAIMGSPSFTTGVNGAANTALSLNGSSQYVSLGHPTLYDFGNNDFTFSVWFQTTTTGTPQQLFSCDDMSGRQFIFDINDLSAGTVTAYLQNQSAVVGYRTGNILSPNTWYHAVLVRQGNAPGALTLYLNGAAVSSFAAFQNDFPFTMGTTTSEVDIGRRTYAGYQQYFSGSMSGMRVYNRALSASEIATLYANGVTGGKF